MQAGYEDDGLERELIRLDVRPWRLGGLQIAREAFDGCTCLGRLVRVHVSHAEQEKLSRPFAAQYLHLSCRGSEV